MFEFSISQFNTNKMVKKIAIDMSTTRKQQEHENRKCFVH